LPQQITLLSERRRKTKSGKNIALALDDLHKQTDALFVGLQKQPGHVVAMVSPEGRAAVERILCGLHIEWTAVRSNPASFPDDWREFDFVVPGIVEAVKAKNLPTLELPKHLIEITPVEQMTPDQLSCMMMFAANAQGVRAMMFSEKTETFTSSIPKNCLN
jgi:hypothetical protein